MQRRVHNRVGVAAVTVVLSLLAFPLTAHANPGSGVIDGGATIEFGRSGACDETGEGGAWGGYTPQDDHGFYSLNNQGFKAGTAAGVSTGTLNLCGEMSRQPADDAVVGAVGAACELGQAVSGKPAPAGRDGHGSLAYDSGTLSGHHIQLRDVRMAFTPASGMVFTGEYTSSPGMPNASTGTAAIYVQVGTIANECLLSGGARYGTVVNGGSFALIPD